MTLTSGTGILTSIFDHYGALVDGIIEHRNNGVLVSMCAGKSLTYALVNLQDRGQLFVGPGVDIYEGMLVGINSRQEDMIVNPTKAKKLDNMRVSGKEETIQLIPPVIFSLEQALEFIDDDELVEVTPNHLRLRKIHLTENERKRAAKNK